MGPDFSTLPNIPFTMDYFPAALGAAFFLTLAGLDFPKEALAILPFFVLMSPRPMINS